MNLADFHFLRPLWLLTLVPTAWILWQLHQVQTGVQSWKMLCDEKLLSHLLIQQPGGKNRSYWWLALLGWTLAIIAMAGPSWNKLNLPVQTLEKASVILLDLSRSMDATDIAPSRIERAKLKLRDFLAQRKEGQTALVAYAGGSYVVSPLTSDSKTIAALIPALSTALMPTQGANLVDALERAAALLQQAGFASQGDILLFTDEVHLNQEQKMVETLHKRGYRISVIGVGTAEGAPIPLPEQGGFLKDRNGTIVIPALDENALRTLANLGGGQYSPLRSDDLDLQTITNQDRLKADTGKESAGSVEQWEDRGPWLLVLIVPMVAFAFRRGWLSALLFASFLVPPPTHAVEWDALWSRPDQRGEQLYQQKKYPEAANSFESPAHKGAAQYRAGDYAKAAESFQQGYNYATSLAKSGKLKEALSAYDEVLKLQPNQENAKINHDLIEQFLKEQQQEQQQNQQDDQKKDQQKNQDSQQKSEQNSDQSAQQNDKNEQGQQQQNKDQTGKKEQPSDGQPSDAKPSSDEQQKAEQPQQQQGSKDTAKTDPSKEKAAKEAAQSPKPEQSAKTEQEQAALPSPDAMTQEQQQATEQWLKKIPDDPAGLLRRKFQLEHQKRGDAPQPKEAW